MALTVRPIATRQSSVTTSASGRSAPIWAASARAGASWPSPTLAVTMRIRGGTAAPTLSDRPDGSEPPTTGRELAGGGRRARRTPARPESASERLRRRLDTGLVERAQQRVGDAAVIEAEDAPET